MSEATEHPDKPRGPEEPRAAARGPEQSGSEGPGTGAKAPTSPSDADAWATACAEDLAAEQTRRRAQHGPPPGSAAEELRRLLDTVADRLSGLSGGAAPLFGMAAQGAVQQAVRQARAAVEPVLERNPDVLEHLAAAGSELLAAYRSAVTAQERRWTRTARSTPPGQDAAGDVPRDEAGPADHRDHPRHGGGDGPPQEGTGAGEHIDLD